MHPSKRVILGEPAIDLDGSAGTVAAILVRPRTGDSPALVIKRNLLIRKQRVVPVEAIVGATDDAIHLGITHRELDAFPEFRFSPYLAPQNFPQAVGSFQPAGVRVVRVGQQVVCLDGEAGTVEFATLDTAARRVNYFVASHRRRDRLTRIDPVLVQEITRSLLLLDAGRADFDSLPLYRQDHEIEADVLTAIWRDSELQVADLQSVRVRSLDGIVELSGSVRTQKARYEIFAAARGVPGVLSILDQMDDIAAFEALATQTIDAIEQARASGNPG